MPIDPATDPATVAFYDEGTGTWARGVIVADDGQHLTVEWDNGRATDEHPRDLEPRTPKAAPPPAPNRCECGNVAVWQITPADPAITAPTAPLWFCGTHVTGWLAAPTFHYHVRVVTVAQQTAGGAQ